MSSKCAVKKRGVYQQVQNVAQWELDKEGGRNMSGGCKTIPVWQKAMI